MFPHKTKWSNRKTNIQFRCSAKREDVRRRREYSKSKQRRRSKTEPANSADVSKNNLKPQPSLFDREQLTTATFRLIIPYLVRWPTTRAIPTFYFRRRRATFALTNHWMNLKVLWLVGRASVERATYVAIKNLRNVAIATNRFRVVVIQLKAKTNKQTNLPIFQ